VLVVAIAVVGGGVVVVVVVVLGDEVVVVLGGESVVKSTAACAGAICVGVTDVGAAGVVVLPPQPAARAARITMPVEI
tara:strand:+ start:598 stop:831 length:234 start_codon:yes stop_codon:yes gene_type:complete